MSEELKTLKDIEEEHKRICDRHCFILCEDIKQEAIKWVEEMKSKLNSMADTPEAFALWAIWFMQYTHNITKEDLK